MLAAHFYFEHADNSDKDVMVWLGALWISRGWQTTSLSSEQIDRIRSVAHYGRYKLVRFSNEPSQPDVPSSLRWKAWSRFAGPARTIRLSRSEKQTNSPARCLSIPLNARSSRRASLAMAAAGRDGHCLGSKERTANQPGGCRFFKQVYWRHNFICGVALMYLYEFVEDLRDCLVFLRTSSRNM